MSSAAGPNGDSGNEADPRSTGKKASVHAGSDPYSAGSPGSWEIRDALAARKARAHFLEMLRTLWKFWERSGTTDQIRIAVGVGNDIELMVEASTRSPRAALAPRSSWASPPLVRPPSEGSGHACGVIGGLTCHGCGVSIGRKYSDQWPRENTPSFLRGVPRPPPGCPTSGFSIPGSGIPRLGSSSGGRFRPGERPSTLLRPQLAKWGFEALEHVSRPDLVALGGDCTNGGDWGQAMRP